MHVNLCINTAAVKGMNDGVCEASEKKTPLSQLVLVSIGHVPVADFQLVV